MSGRLPRRQALGALAALAALLLLPHVADTFWVLQIAAQALILGTLALSLTFLAAYLGVVSLAQVTVAGFAAYAIAYFGPNTAGLGVPLPWPATVALALAAATLGGGLIGLIAHRSTGIYAIMITLAISVAFFYLTRQNYSLFNGWNGFAGLRPPAPFGLSLAAPLPFYHLCLALAVVLLCGVLLFVRSPLGLAIQGVRDGARRMRALGFRTLPLIVAAYSVAGLIAGCAGILGAWYHGRVSSFSVGLGPTIDILIIAVIGGLVHPAGAYLGALVFVLVDTFAIDLVDRDRFNTVIGLVFLLIVLASPDGLIGLLRAGLARFGLRRGAEFRAPGPPVDIERT